jgi:large subunit ribosomal protein L29
MKAAELRQLDGEALQARCQELDDQLFRLRVQKALGQLEAPGKVRALRRERARVLTILGERKKAE